MQKRFIVSVIVLVGLFCGFLIFHTTRPQKEIAQQPQKAYWLLLKRKSEKEYLYYGVLGDAHHSRLIKSFQVKTGVSQKSPTPLPQLFGREYWLITQKESSAENPDTAPYFLTLNIPVSEGPPYGPVPYIACEDPITQEKVQCDWELPGYFGLHGVNGNSEKLAKENPGSSGCIRHKDEDITYLYSLLNPEEEAIRYYIIDA